MASHGVRFKWARNVEDEAVSDRVIFLDRSTDSAVVLFLKGDLQLPELPIALLPAGEACGIGTDIGWLGLPAIEPNTLCFSAGVVSARRDPPNPIWWTESRSTALAAAPFFIVLLPPPMAWFCPVRRTEHLYLG